VRSLYMIAVVCLILPPAYAGMATYTYEVTSGTLTLDVEPNGLVSPDPVNIVFGGTFSVTFDSDDGSIGESDTFILQDAGLHNTEQITVDVFMFLFSGTITAPVGGLYITDFAPVAWGHLDADGIGSLQTDVYGGGHIYINLPGIYVGWGTENTWSEQVETYDLDFEIVDGLPVAVTMVGAFTYLYYIPDIGGGPEFGQGVEIHAQLIPEPTVVGLVVLAWGGAVRFRRRAA
jgi:hypothetical protein